MGNSRGRQRGDLLAAVGEKFMTVDTAGTSAAGAPRTDPA
jgi:hypothetical protein